MTDCFNYAASEKPVSVNYVFADRNYSDKARDDMRAILGKRYGLNKTGDEDKLPERQYGMWTVGQLINHELHAIGLEDGWGFYHSDTTRNIEESTAQDEDATTREIAESDHAAAMREADEISEDDLEAAAAFIDKYDHTQEQRT
jgi:hypothetical protein